MKFIKVFSLILALLMIGGAMVACGGNGSEPQGSGESENQVVSEPIHVNICVRATVDGENVYDSEPYGYDFIGSTRTVAKILEEFMSFEMGIDVVYDDEGKLKQVGDIEAGVGQFWMFSVAKAPKGAAQAEAIDANIETYDKIQDGDTIVIYLGGLVAAEG